MRTSLVRMGKHFGNLGKIYGEYRFAISPYEQKAFKNFFNDAFVNVYKSYVRNLWYYYVPPFTTVYLVVSWAKKENVRLSRKNPADYENDK